MQPKILGLLFMGTPEHIELGLLGAYEDTKTDEFFGGYSFTDSANMFSTPSIRFFSEFLGFLSILTFLS